MHIHKLLFLMLSFPIALYLSPRYLNQPIGIRTSSWQLTLKETRSNRLNTAYDIWHALY